MDRRFPITRRLAVTRRSAKVHRVLFRLVVVAFAALAVASLAEIAARLERLEASRSADDQGQA